MAKSPKSRAGNSAKRVALSKTTSQKNSNIEEVKKGKKNFDVTKVRDFLALNKVFFETVAATFLAAMAIILSVGQYQVTKDQTAYLEQQTIIERELASPQFVILSQTVPNEETGSHDDDKIFIHNAGNIALNLKIDTAVFFKLTYINKSDFREILVPVSGYYWRHIYTGEVTGLVMTVDQQGNNAKRSVLQDDISKIIEGTDEILNLEVQRYLVLSYQDIFNTTHIDYYFVKPFTNGELMDIEEGKVMFEQFKSNITTGNNFDLDTMTAQDIYQLFQK